jgi:TetR/AcrR family transcriptional regulator
MARTPASPGPEVRKKQILDAAIEVFGQSGYGGATAAEIADKVGLSSGSVFHYFGNKKELFRQALRSCAVDLRAAMERGNPPTDDIKTFLKMTSRNFFAYLLENPMKVKILFHSPDTLADQDIKYEYRRVMEDLYQFVYSMLEDACKRGELPEDLYIQGIAEYMLGFSFFTSYLSFLGVEWFQSGGVFRFTDGDYLIDYLTRPQKGRS